MAETRKTSNPTSKKQKENENQKENQYGYRKEHDETDGYFNGAFNGIDVSVKDSKRFAETNGWGYFTFGHHPLPYDKTAAEKPVAECAGCHLANVGSTDMTWIQFYPLLRDKKGY